MLQLYFWFLRSITRELQSMNMVEQKYYYFNFNIFTLFYTFAGTEFSTHPVSFSTPTPGTTTILTLASTLYKFSTCLAYNW